MDTRSQPVRCQKKSKCHQERRNSPSVASCRPTSSCLRMIFLISSSSTALSCAGVISPFSRLARASFSGARAQQAADLVGAEGGVGLGHEFLLCMPAPVPRRSFVGWVKRSVDPTRSQNHWRALGHRYRSTQPTFRLQMMGRIPSLLLKSRQDLRRHGRRLESSWDRPDRAWSTAASRSLRAPARRPW